ncbi:monocarboxylate transporter 13-like isoform X2 [Palaemon carinicauda]|uniref:monocarboxylate transporter 13-like isoform X2 n=1 Tax=Palaemon carinicauda TaxID=392227 RepID=UPI0035B57CF9
MTISYIVHSSNQGLNAWKTQPESDEVETLNTLSMEKKVQTKSVIVSKINEKKDEATDVCKAEEQEPPDGGWGWCIVFANTICTMMMTTQGPCFGIFYGERLRELEATPTLTTWLFNFQSLIWNLAGPWAGLLGSKFGLRPVAMTSAFVAASSLILSASVSGSPLYFLLTFSLLSGTGGGICINSCYLMSAKYFKKRLGLANGIMVTGGSAGLIAMPLLASWLQEHLSFEWATVIAGCLMMLTVPATALFHPVEWHLKLPTPQDKEAPSDTTQTLLEEERSERSKEHRSNCAQQLEEEEGVWRKFLSHYKPSVLRDPLVITTALCTCISITTVLNVFSTVPFVLNDAGYSLQESARAMSVAAFSDLVTRAVCAAVVDFSWVNVRLLYAFAQIIAILAANALLPVSGNYPLVLLAMGSLGIGLGIMYVLDVFIIIRVLGIERMQSVFGISQLLRVFAFATLGPLGGVLREVTGTYDASIILYTFSIMFGLLLLLFTCVYTYFWTPKRDQRIGV